MLTIRMIKYSQIAIHQTPRILFITQKPLLQKLSLLYLYLKQNFINLTIID